MTEHRPTPPYRVDLDAELGRAVEETARQLGVAPHELVQTLVRDFTEFTRQRDRGRTPASPGVQPRSGRVIDIEEARRRRASGVARRRRGGGASTTA